METVLLVVSLIILVSAVTIATLLARYTIGTVGNLSCLEPKITYHVTKQVLTDDNWNTIIVKNATGKGQSRWVRINSQLAPDVSLVKIVGDKKGNWELVPVEFEKRGEEE